MKHSREGGATDRAETQQRGIWDLLVYGFILFK